jgi:hypothetical protein
VLDYGRQLDAVAKDFGNTLRQEATRISRMVGDYQAHLLAKQRAAESAAKAELSRIEREREAQLAQAPSLEAREAIHERAAQEIQMVAPPPAPPRVEGQRIEETWEFEVTDPYELAKHHPLLVKIEPKRREIVEALKAGRDIRGITAKKVVNAGVRVSKPKELAVATI